MALRERPFCSIWNLRPCMGKNGSLSFRMSTYPLCSSSEVILFEYTSFILNAVSPSWQPIVADQFRPEEPSPDSVSPRAWPDSFSTPHLDRTRLIWHYG